MSLDCKIPVKVEITDVTAVLASSMKLQYPLNDALPNTEHTRDRLLAGIFTFRRHDIGRDVPDEDFSLLYAYGMFKRFRCLHLC